MHDADSEQEMAGQGGFASGLRDNPAPLFLIGAGIGWLLLSQARRTERYEQAADWAERRSRGFRRRVRHAYEDARDRAGDVVEGTRDRLASAAEQIGLRDGAAGEARHGGQDDEGQRLVGRTRDAISSFGESFRDIVDEHPLATGLMGLALGMAIGSSLPRTATEDDVLGGYRDDLLDRARDALQEVRSKAGEAVDAGVDAVENQVRTPANG